ncbi:ABC transporter permease [Methylomonas sp. AM2-LC]|uniref:ABC transporter permease n=1 Tax=Methylomonas sp. AM2-LC TaxID=3153301 RepID=UPI0032651609
MLSRITTLILKELHALLRDRQSRVILIVPVILELALFPFAATLEVNNNTLAVFNEDNGQPSFELIQRFSQAQAFSELISLYKEADINQVLDNQHALMVIRIPADFSRNINAGSNTSIQVLLDGRRSNSGQIALGYVQQILQAFSVEGLHTKQPFMHAQLLIRNRYNPNLDYVRHIVPSLVAIITTISTLIVTALSVAREREQGTLDQLLVSPLTPGMIMVGKTVPAMIVAMLQATIILLAGIFIYKIPFVGSFSYLYLSMIFYILALAGFGLLISSICATQQQAFLGVFSFVMPTVLLSGFVSPIENMPVWLQYLDWFNPLRHFIVIVKGVFLKDIDLSILLPNLWPLLIIALITLVPANWMFRRHLG